METSQEVGELFAALSKAQGTMKGAVKDSENPFYKSKYADLASVWDACRAALSNNGLAVIQVPSSDGPKVSVTTVLGHGSGQWIRDTLTMECKDATPQVIGSAISYARRYGLSAVVGIAPEDDDAESAQPRTQMAPLGAGKVSHATAETNRAGKKVDGAPLTEPLRKDEIPF